MSNVKKTVEDIIQLDISNVSAGAFVFMCKSTEDTKKEFEEKLNELSKIKFPKAIIIGSSETYLEFFNYALEIASLKRVKTSVTAIEGDAVAKKELAAKLTSCQNLLFNSLYINFEKADWKFNNKKINTKNLSSIASDVSDQVYNLTPKVQNELIVRDKQSSMAVAGTYNLINRILNNSHEKSSNVWIPAEFEFIYQSLKQTNYIKI